MQTGTRAGTGAIQWRIHPFPTRTSGLVIRAARSPRSLARGEERAVLRLHCCHYPHYSGGGRLRGVFRVLRCGPSRAVAVRAGKDSQPDTRARANVRGSDEST